VPLGAHATVEGGGLRLRTFVAAPEGDGLLRGEALGAEPVELGRRLAADLVARGALELMGR